MAQRNAARTVASFIVLSATAGPLLGWTAATQMGGALIRPAAAAEYDSPVTSRDLKGDRLYLLAAIPPMMPADLDYSFAALEPRADSPAAIQDAAPAAEPSNVAALAPPLPPQRPKRPSELAGTMLDDSQIASIKTRLRLTPDQAEHWPAVEAALREVVKLQAREARRKPTAASPARIDVNSPEVQKLVWAAMPLLTQLREDQKREVRTLVRVIGLDTVAAKI